MIRAALTLLAALTLSTAPALAQPPLANPDFEEGELNAAPAGWRLTTPGYRALLTEDNAFHGKRCARLEHDPDFEKGDPAPFGNLVQSIDAAPFRGKIVSFAASVSYSKGDQPGQAQLWFRVDRPDQRPGFFDNMHDRPITMGEWKEYRITGEIAPDAERIVLGVMLLGDGSARVDNASLTITGDAVNSNLPPQPLTPRALENLTAFTRAYGYVRYFHPSDAGASADWNTIAINGAAHVSLADDAPSLAAALTRSFAEVAPLALFGANPFDAPADPPKGALTRWSHIGLGSGDSRNIYRSTRAEIDAGALNPGEPTCFTAALPGGVFCSIPLVLTKEQAARLSNVDRHFAPVPRSPTWHPNAEDRATRLADVIILWNILEHSFPYFDVIEGGDQWPDALRAALTTAATDTSETEFLDTLRRLVAKLHDGHGFVMHAAAMHAYTLPFPWEFVGDQLVIAPRDQIERDSPQPGDVVLAIDGRPVPELITHYQPLISAASPGFFRYRLAAELAGSVKPGAASLKLRDPVGAERTVNVERVAASARSEFSEPRPAKIAEVKPGIWYVDIDRITDADFTDALDSLSKAKGIVFDLRGYPRRLSTIVLQHLTDKTMTSAQWHTPRFTQPDRADMTFAKSGWPVEPVAPKFTEKVAFIIDGRAVSYAETYMGIVENYHLAAIVGQPTAATNGNINIHELPGGYRVGFTGMKVLKHDGSRHHGVGITPTVPVTRTIKGMAEGRDEFLEKAIEVVSAP